MNYAEHLRALLAPLGVYDLKAPINGAALDVKGAALDQMEQLLEEMERECDLTTAEGWGLEAWKGLFALLPAASDAERLRRSMQALLRIGNHSATLPAIQDTLSGCGLSVAVRELGAGRVEVSFPEVRGIPEQFERLQYNIEQILPAHVEVEYMIRYLTWAELEALRWTFGNLSSKTWDELERGA